LRKSELSIHKCAYTREVSLNPNSSTLEPDLLQLDRPAACVIAQQYSSATFVSLCAHYRKGQFGARLKNFIISASFTFF
jgi:hypothetical protein